jgi:SAM-dependent methyltransferase
VNDRAVAAAYTAAGEGWQAGPGRIYDRLAVALVDRCPGGVADRTVLDVGAGTGAASRASLLAGARSVIALDLAVGMLLHDGAHRPPAVAGDSVALPVRDGAFGAVVAAFSLNHLTDPSAGLVEAARALAPGGGLVAGSYAADDTHPVKEAVTAAAVARGWAPDAWYETVRAEALPRLASVEGAARDAAVLPGAVVGELRVAFPDMTAPDLVAWRLGMAQLAGFVARLAPADRADLEADALARLGPAPPPLVRSCITIAWRRPG